MKKLHQFCLALLLISTLLSLIFMLLGKGTEGKDFGPGAYYYTDIPDWQERFYPENDK